MSSSILETLTIETLQRMVVDLLLYDVLSLCEDSNKMRQVCNNDGLWKTKLQKDFPDYVDIDIVTDDNKDRYIKIYNSMYNKYFVDTYEYPNNNGSLALYYAKILPLNIHLNHDSGKLGNVGGTGTKGNTAYIIPDIWIERASNFTGNKHDINLNYVFEHIRGQDSDIVNEYEKGNFREVSDDEINYLINDLLERGYKVSKNQIETYINVNDIPRLKQLGIAKVINDNSNIDTVYSLEADIYGIDSYV